PAPAAAPRQPTLLGSVGVGRILNAMAEHPALCSGPPAASAGDASPSLLDSVGVTGLFRGLTDSGS
ncbi:hypothetical protein ACWEPC_43660, partial [Nonomuraea sp. NPDC004297]